MNKEKHKLDQAINEAINEEELLELIRDLIKIPSHYAYDQREIPIANFLKK